MLDIYQQRDADERKTVLQLVDTLPLDAEARQRIVADAAGLVRNERAWHGHGVDLDAFLHEYSLSSEEGVLLMCLAEALLRIPDNATVERLIADKLGSGDWQRHLGQSDSLFVNASTWGIMLTGRLVRLDPIKENDLSSQIGALANRLTEPVLRVAISRAMHILARQFILGDTIEDALQRSRAGNDHTYRYSFDMLGEAAVTAADAQRYLAMYRQAIETIGPQRNELTDNPGISIKLSALHPRYLISRRTEMLAELAPRVLDLAHRACAYDIPITIDAEESRRQPLALEIFEIVSERLQDWDGLGIAVQCYLKSAPAVIGWLARLSERHQRRFMLRLVKGAYWDGEIKHAQVQGHDSYPVFTRKSHTDICYLGCAARLLARPDCFYPQFATHNAHTLMSVLELAGNRRGFEFQLLHGMGESLYHQVAGDPILEVPCRVYAPVGPQRELLSYLVRRLIENGANSSFVNRIQNKQLAAEIVVADPVTTAADDGYSCNPVIPLPPLLYPGRQNAAGVDLADPLALHRLDESLSDYVAHQWHAVPANTRRQIDGTALPVINPADKSDCVGYVHYANSIEIEQTVKLAIQTWPEWSQSSAESRAGLLDAMARQLEQHRAELMALVIRETGKTVADAVAEIREAVDYCRYYALQCRNLFTPQPLSGPTGESNTLTLHGRGVFVCISPWNFPLAIYCGQIAAALAAGNCVIAKPAEQSSLTGSRATGLFHSAGVAVQVLQCLPGDGDTGAALVAASGIAGVSFTGSVPVAHAIHTMLASKPGPIGSLIAETGGINCMIVDSSALAEQVVEDVLSSAFQSAGQRCSALRVLFLQTDIADAVLSMLAAALDERLIGNPAWLATDIGPLIEVQAVEAVRSHLCDLAASARHVHTCRMPTGLAEQGHFVAPCIYEIDRLAQLEQEVFGPVLHVVRFEQHALQSVVEQVNASGYGLTLALHSRLDSTIEYVTKHVNVGNIYVNRNQIGAVVGVQPFGGEGLSGTGPKAGGPYTLLRYATERAVTVNTTAQGGNAELLREADSPEP
jgi:RHH-type proline utilization regulon transcriptional repressor/proline dehydrogenase/delta 1-pyrroline-5-carboxylate dehydrogenase